VAEFPREKYNDAFYEAFDLDKTADLTQLKYQSIDEWDSIGHMTLMSELEDNFDITISTEDLVQFESYNQGTDILQRYSIEIK
jgi:acyl carrier protein